MIVAILPTKFHIGKTYHKIDHLDFLNDGVNKKDPAPSLIIAESLSIDVSKK